ncbi:NERD domain-containing protein [Acinetobacter sp. ANC 5380]|uniref:NERD domain-containing protein n=1 Tax=Acinetobacter terrae TaxID=2731247 RepID=A0A7Y2W9S1_9GAMM|nr:nuclease-related domain-containing protein [Acinetobacter terrae]NNH76520.1 NERD domain-containing protein [Acinetobacter terrae]
MIGERIVSHKLLFYFYFGSSKVCNDITFLTKSGNTTQIDHLVVSRKGIFCIETKNLNGVIKGNKDDQYWSYKNVLGNTSKIYNPLFQNASHVRHVSSLLGISQERIERFVTNVGKAKLKSDIYKFFGPNLIKSGTGFIFNLWLKPKSAFSAEEVKEFCEIINERVKNIDQDTKNNHVNYVKRINKKNSGGSRQYIYWSMGIILVVMAFWLI